MPSRKYEELFSGTGRFTTGTRTRLERAIGRALFGYRGGLLPLRSAVRSATHELRGHGLADAAILAILAAVVENAGRSCGADRTALLTGEPTWMPLRTRVVASAEDALAALAV
jgi:hypothetical protein